MEFGKSVVMRVVMPEISEFLLCDSAPWYNLAFEWSRGTGHLDNRPYYLTVTSSGKSTKMLLISAVPSKTQAGAIHTTDYLRLNHRMLMRLLELVTLAFGK